MHGTNLKITEPYYHSTWRDLRTVWLF